MLICPRCETSLAQSEVAGSYQDVTDISVTVKFELTSSLDTDIPARLRLDEVQADGRMNANDTNSTNGEKYFYWHGPRHRGPCPATLRLR